MHRILDWFDQRTGYRSLVAPLRQRVLPRGPSWWYASASCMLWLFVIQVLTGLLLMTSYSPSATTAWGSVHYTEQSPAGAFLRGVHHFAAQAMIILLAMHILRVLLTAAYRAPRELIWITGLLLFPLMLVWTITGNPLSGSQQGMTQIEVEGNIIGSTPLVGPYLQRILIGGDEVGNLTLTHLYALHVGWLPVLVVPLLVIHLRQIYRHSAAPGGEPVSARARPYWPYQTVRNMLVLTVVLGATGASALHYGAPLDAPADPEAANSPRPEWYFLWLFELRRYFTGDWEFVATVLIPAIVLVVLLAVPVIDRLCPRRMSMALRALLVLIGAVAWATLTVAPLARDRQDEDFRRLRVEVRQRAERARKLADHQGVPPEGAAELLRSDPKTQGPILFQRHCASCHSHTDENGHGIAAQEPSAPNLYGFGSHEWIAALLSPAQIAGPHYFGTSTKATGEMVSTIADLFDQAHSSQLPAARDKLVRQLDQVAWALADEAGLPGLAQHDNAVRAAVAEGRKLLERGMSCTDCHRFHDKGDLGAAPDLTGYASRDWLIGIISNPQHERFYPGQLNDRMPAFIKHPARPEANVLSPQEVRLIVDWLRRDWYEPSTESAAAVIAKEHVQRSQN
jgi:ubiquinol-cytochrome c reductase cytochrome b subunit